MKDLKHLTHLTVFKELAKSQRKSITLESLGIGSKVPTIQMGFYIEKDLSDILKSLNSTHGRGTNSRIVNYLLRELFIEENLLEPTSKTTEENS